MIKTAPRDPRLKLVPRSESLLARLISVKGGEPPLTQLPSSQQVVDAVEARQVKNNRPKLPTERISISLIGKCEREILYQMAGTEAYQPTDQAPSEQDRLKWDEAAQYGDFIHEAWQNALIAANLVQFQYSDEDDQMLVASVERNIHELVGVNRTLLEEYGLSGRLDGVGIQGENIEFKSIASKNFDPSLPWFIDQLKPAQATLYMYFLGQLRTRFVCIEREATDWFSFGTVQEFDFYLDERYAERLLIKAEKIQQARKAGELLPGQPGERARNCRFCGYKQYCPAYQEINSGRGF